MQKMINVLLDANIILLSFERNINIFEAIRQILCTKVNFVVLSTTLDELKRLALRGPKMAKFTECAIRLVRKNCKLVQVPKEVLPDEALIEKAREMMGIVATNDKELRKRLRAEHIPRILVTEDGRFLVEGFVP